jgi:DtxR family Mn-dependent transcriptional regulator
MPNKTIEGYIEVIYDIEKKRGVARTSDIARVLGVREASVTEMLQKLQEKRYVQYSAYHGACLTPQGKKYAKHLNNKHTILADFFRIVGIEKKTADDDACEIEHHISNETIQCLAEFVNFAKNRPYWVNKFRNHYKMKTKNNIKKS